MATGTITNTIKDPSGNAIASVIVTFTLKPGPGFRISDGTEIAEITTATSNSSGVYTINLEQNANITPTNSYYEVNEAVPQSLGGPNIWTIQVQSGTHTVLESLASILPPGSAMMSASNTPITLVTGESASAGTSSQFIRADASLGVPIGTPLTNAVEIGNSVDAGSSGEFADSAHVHAVASGLPSSLIVGGSNVAGTNAAFPHLDHKHGLPAFGVPVSTSNANSIGSSGLFSQSDHVHNTIGGGPSGSITPINLSVGESAAAGSANTFIRGDAVFGIALEAPAALTVGGSNIPGASSNFNAADHKHGLPAFGVPVSTGGANDIGSSGLFAQSDHIHNTVAGGGGSNTAITLHTGDTAAAGTSTNFVRGDAVLGIPVIAPTGLTCGNASNTTGVDTRFIRPDHVHATPKGIPLSNTLTNTAGSSGNFADAAHTHIGVGGLSPTLAVGDSASTGSSPLALRSDAVIGVPVGSPVSLVIGGTGSQGTSTDFPRSDHIHPLPAFGTPVAVGGSNQIGTSGLFAQSDHVHLSSGGTASQQVFTYAWTATASALVNSQTLSLTAVAGQSTFVYPGALTTQNVIVSFNVTGRSTITGGVWSIAPSWDAVGPTADQSVFGSAIDSTHVLFSGQTYHMLKHSATSTAAIPDFYVNLLAGMGSETITTPSHLTIQMVCMVAS